MESKLSTAILCFLGLFSIVQALPSEPEDSGKSITCSTYADCLSGETGRQEIIKCFNNLKPEEVKQLYQSIHDKFNCKSNTIYEGFQEYCEMDDAEKRKAHTITKKEMFAFEQMACADGSKKDECSRAKKLINCYFGYLDQLSQQGKCKIDA